ncbi:MAG TPA: peptidylprolyl isomerase [Pyrinomonadaceae bacterium]|jgi:cyclophilin family peptidyl-prolyl cis-trans isomerase/HEAT repeat protein
MIKNRRLKIRRSRRRSLPQKRAIRFPTLACALVLLWPSGVLAQKKQSPPPERNAKAAPASAVSDEIMLRIMRAEDERRWEATDLGVLMFDADSRVRRRAALAAGRIGDERAVASLIALLQNDKETRVRAMAAFALGETESAAGAMALRAQLSSKSDDVRARAIEALGKIVAALPKEDEARVRELGAAILGALAAEAGREPRPDKDVILMGLTAVLRARPTGAGPAIARFLSNADWRIRADAANTLARLRAKDGVEKLRELVLGDSNAVVRANAARALGAAENREAFEPLLNRSVNDADERVRVSAVRALGALKDARAAGPLLQRAATLTASYLTTKRSGVARPVETGELLEIAAALGRLLPNTGDERAVAWLREFRAAEGGIAPEVEIAFARIAPAIYLRESNPERFSAGVPRIGNSGNGGATKDWRQISSLAQGLGDLAAMTAEAAGSTIVSLQADAQITLRSLLEDKALPALAAPDVMNALNAFKPNDLAEVLRRKLTDKDILVRATAAQLLSEFPPDEANTRSLVAALPGAMRDELNDAALAILDALGKQRTQSANDAIKLALDSTDHLLRRRAVALLKDNNAGDFQARIAVVQTNHTLADYQRALARAGKQVRAVVSTDKGVFTIELLPEDAPLTVDSFVQLAQRGFFNNLTFHRVVPNFVIQGGDPRGDGNGGPGYQIRCEINEARYEHGAVGMALSGKDTGGSQWFVTHSPQPHLDGGYTVFGRVREGLEVIDRIMRGDVIRTISITETARAASKAPETQAKPEKKKTPSASTKKRASN